MSGANFARAKRETTSRAKTHQEDGVISMHLNWKIRMTVVVLSLLSPAMGTAANVGELKAGAARVDITPSAKAIPPPFSSIHDPLFARAIYLENGIVCAILLNADVGGISNASADRASAAISRELKVPTANILISATHDHNAIFGGPRRSGSGASETAPSGPSEEFLTKLESGLIQAAHLAHDRMKPARIGYGTGRLYLNVNRDAVDERTRLWSQEPNLEYPSDKTLAVIKIESVTGDLIAVYMNYAMHANLLFLEGMISGDFPGEAERYIEHTYNDNVVAIWTSGAAGDQNPLYLRPNREIGEKKIHAVMNSEHVDLGAAIMRAMFTGSPEADKAPVDTVALEQSLELIKSMGQLTAEESLRVIGQISVMNAEARIEGTQREITCPARRRLDSGREGVQGQYVDSPDPVRIRIGALEIGDVVLGSANAELYNMIGQEVKAGSKFHNTVMVTLTNGMANSGYVPTDDAFGRYTFQVLGSSLKPGCAESAIVSGVDDMIEKLN